MKLFANVQEMLEEIRAMESDEQKRREDRATVSAFFNGKPPLSQKQADAMGLKIVTNNLFGYTDLAASKEATLALYTKPPRLWMVGLDKAPAADKCAAEMGVTNLLNKMVKKNGRLRLPYEGVAGDATLHGEGEFYFPDARCPLPRHLPLSKRLIPNGSLADPNELTHFAICHDLTLSEICFHIRNESHGWNLAALRKIKNRALEKLDKGNWTNRMYGAVDTLNPEELEYARQEQGNIDRVFRARVPVYYFFQVDPDRDGKPLDLNILLKYDDHEQSILGKGTSLFDEEEFYPSIGDAIQPFFMDCILGGEPKWHRVKGQGHLNYSIAWHVEMLMCRLMQAAGESAQNWWQVDNTANREALEKILLKHNAIVPEGVSLLANRPEMNFQGVLQVLSIFQQRAARNARSSFSNNPEDGGTKELQVQAMFRQNSINAQQSSRLANWYEQKSRLGSVILSRYTNPHIDPSDRYYSEIMEFQSGLKRLRIPLYWVQPFNVTVTATRITGDGDDMKAKTAAVFFMQNMAMYPPESQQKLKRIVTGIMADDYELAEDLIPIDDKPPAEQSRAADGENNTAIVQGRPPELAASDIDEAHVEVHLKGLVSIIQQASQLQQETFKPEQLLAFKALGAHTIAHIQRMAQMGKKEPAAKYMDAMNQLAKMAEKLRHNLEQQQQAQAEQGEGADPIEAAKLELAKANLDLAAKKQEFATYKFERVQAAKEHNTAIDGSLKLAKDAREEDKHRIDRGERDARLALDVTAAAREATVPATV